MIPDTTYKTSANFTLGQLKEACEYLWRTLPRNTGMPDAADTLLDYIKKLEKASIELPNDETVTLLKAWTTDRLIRYETAPRSLGWNSYDMAYVLFYKMFLAMTSRQYPSLDSLKYHLDHDRSMEAGYRAIVARVSGILKDREEGREKDLTLFLRSWCLQEIEVCLIQGDEEAIHAYIFILALFH